MQFFLLLKHRTKFFLLLKHSTPRLNGGYMQSNTTMKTAAEQFLKSACFSRFISWISSTRDLNYFLDNFNRLRYSLLNTKRLLVILCFRRNNRLSIKSKTPYMRFQPVHQLGTKQSHSCIASEHHPRFWNHRSLHRFPILAPRSITTADTPTGAKSLGCAERFLKVNQLISQFRASQH